jgi:hypothetical protein
MHTAAQWVLSEQAFTVMTTWVAEAKSARSVPASAPESMFSVPAEEPAVIVNVPVVLGLAMTTRDTEEEEPATPDRVMGMSKSLAGVSLVVTVMALVVAPVYMLVGRPLNAIVARQVELAQT